MRFIETRFTIRNSTLFCARRYLRRFLHLGAGVSLERARRGKLAQLVAHHVFRNINRQVSFAVVHAKRQANHVRRNRRTPRPGLDHRRPVAARAHALDSLLNAVVNERSLF